MRIIVLLIITGEEGVNRNAFAAKTQGSTPRRDSWCKGRATRDGEFHAETRSSDAGRGKSRTSAETAEGVCEPSDGTGFTGILGLARRQVIVAEKP
jgi:hypothetical protein